MTPRSRKPVMLAIFGNSDPKSQNNISLLLEEHEDCMNESNDEKPKEIPLTNLQPSGDDISTANDNGLPVIDKISTGSTSSGSASGSISSAFR